MESEVDLARKVVAWLKEQKWEVYQEVEHRKSGGIADIVATQGPLLWIIETKMRFGLDVVAQAKRWIPYAHYSSVATPWTRNHTEILDEYLRWKGIGRLRVSEFTHQCPVDIEVPARLNRKAPHVSAIKKILKPEHQTYAEAGSACGGRYTPYTATCDELRRYLKDHPGSSLKETIANIKTHYASKQSAVSSLSHWIQAGSIGGVICKKEGRFIKLYLEEISQ